MNEMTKMMKLVLSGAEGMNEMMVLKITGILVSSSYSSISSYSSVHLIHPLIHFILLIFLIPCAIQDWRKRRVSNWLTIPGFAAAWIGAFWFETLPLTVAVFAGCYIAWQMKWMGAADGKLATLIAAVAPPALLISGLLLALTFLILRLRGRPDQHLPAAVWFLAGSLLYNIYRVLSPITSP